MDKSLVRSLLAVSAIGSALAVVPAWPYGFYVLLRLVVCLTAIVTVLAGQQEEGLQRHRLPLVLLAVLFNPLVPVHLDRLVWLPINLATAAYLFGLRRKLGSRQEATPTR